MATKPLTRFIDHLRRATQPHDGGGLTDGNLLACFIERGDEAAFEALVRRHGPMVRGVCRRVLGNPHNADDAFQATFLILVRRAASIRQREAVGSWLYGVAYRTALEAKVRIARRHTREKQVPDIPHPASRPEFLPHDVLSVLDQELSRLPEKHRVAIVLCCLEGRTRKEVASELKIPEGTLSSRLATGRKILAERLTRRGVTLSSGALAAALSANAASASVGTQLAISTVHAATVGMAGSGAASVVSAEAVALMEGVLKVMCIKKLMNIALLTLLVVLVGSFAGLAIQAAFQAPLAGETTARGRDQPVVQKAEIGKTVTSQPRVLNLEGAVSRLAWSPDGKVIGSVSMTSDKQEKVINGEKKARFVMNATVKFWNARKGELKLSLGEEKDVRVESIAFSPDRKTAVLGVVDQAILRAGPYEVRILDAETGAIKNTVLLDTTVRQAVFAPDGKLLAIGGAVIPTDLKGPFHRVVHIWDVEQGKMIGQFKQELDLQDPDKSGYLDGLRDLAFSPDGKLLAAGDADGKVRLLDSRKGKLKHTLDGHSNTVLAVAFSPDGKRLVSANADQSARVWDVQSGKALRTLDRVKGIVWATAFSPDGKLLVTGGVGEVDGKPVGQLIVWDAESWEVRRTLPGDGAVSAVVFSPDGSTLAVGTNRLSDGRASGIIKLWLTEELLRDGAQP